MKQVVVIFCCLPYLVNIIVVNGFVKLVVEIVQELDCLGGSAATTCESDQHLNTHNLFHLWAVSLVKPTMSPKKRVVFSYILGLALAV